MDASADMLRKAREKYLDISFRHADTITFQTKNKFDAVSSNAALYWMKEADKVAMSIYEALHLGGRFVAEFGGQSNVELIISSVANVLKGT